MLDFKDIIVDKLRNLKMTLATAESVTGGMIASSLVSAAGVSSVFKGGVVAYSNKAKIDLLKVQESTLAKYGAISSQVAKEMAVGIIKSLHCDIGIGVTGIAGPEPVENKEVGLVYFCIVVIDRAYEYEAKFKNEGRSKNRIAITSKILEELLKIIIKFTKSE